MARRFLQSASVFLDSAYVIALASGTDEFHQHALSLAEEVEAERIRMVTTTAVLLEVGNALSKLQYRRAAARLIASLLADPVVEIVHLTDDLLAQTVALYSARPDKEWGLTDCLSFVVMRLRNLTEALTADEHFRQAGFRPLLLAAGM